MVKIEDVASIQLDETIYNKPKINILDKDNFILKSYFPSSEAAWEMFLNILDNFEKEKRKLKN